jgi:two-component system chemotaxis response regulator CheY
MGDILVIDDNPDVRAVIAHVLAPPHAVFEAPNGHDALVAFRGGRRFDLILSDLNMPRLGGAQLYWQLVDIMPTQARRMVFMSGSTSIATRELLRVIANPFIEKPFPPRRLRALVQQLLTEWGPVTD